MSINSGAFQLSPNTHFVRTKIQNEHTSSSSLFSSRRSFIAKSANSALLGLIGTSIINPSLANAAGDKSELISDLQTSRDKMDKIPDLLSNGEWDAVRTILKTPPLNKLWNLGEVCAVNEKDTQQSHGRKKTSLCL